MVRHRTASSGRPDPLQLLDGYDQACSILAVLAYAALSEGLFEEGWVGQKAFEQHGGYAGDKRHETGLRKGIQRSVERIRALPGVLYEERGGSKGRQKERRLALPLPPAVDQWFLAHYREYLRPDSCRQFEMTHYKPALTVQDALAGVQPVVVTRLLTSGRHDEAIIHARRSIAQESSLRARGPLLLALANALLRRTRHEDWDEALRVLEELRAVPPSTLLDLYDHLTLVRANVRYAYCRFVLYVRGKSDTEAVREEVERIRAILKSIAPVAHNLSLVDRGQLMNIEGLLLKWEAQVEIVEDTRHERFESADRHLRRALTIWQGAEDSYLVSSLVYNLAELRFVRYRIADGQGSEDEIRDALIWYEASIQLCVNRPGFSGGSVT